MKLWAVEHFVNISSTFLSSLLGGCNSKATPNPPKSDDKNVEEMFTKCSTAQSFIRTEMTTYRIGTLDTILLIFVLVMQWFVLCTIHTFKFYIYLRSYSQKNKCNIEIHYNCFIWTTIFSSCNPWLPFVRHHKLLLNII